MAKLDFPSNPVLDQEYHFSPFTYRWDGEKWKTLGRGSTPVADAINEHKGDSKAHDPALIGALPLNGSAAMTAPLNITTSNNESLVLNYPVGTDGGHIRGREAGNLDWYVGRANSSGHISLYSNKLANGLIVRENSIEAVKPMSIGASGTVFASKALGDTDLNTLLSTVHHGMYYQSASSGATAARNYPTTEAGALIVMGSAHGAQQEFTSYNANRKFVRGKIDSNTWLPWKEISGPKHYMSGFRFTEVTIASTGSANLMPSVFASNLGITMTNGIVTINRTGMYKVQWGFSLLPQSTPQNAVGGFVKNGNMLYSDMIHNYCPANTNGSQMNISSSSIIISLNSGDTLSFQVKAVNNTNVHVYQGGSITIEEL